MSAPSRVPTHAPAKSAAPADRKPPGPRSRIPGRIEAAFLRDPARFLLDAATFGPVSCFRFGRTDIYVVADPHITQTILTAESRFFEKTPTLSEARRVLGAGLVTSEGERHLLLRRIIQPAFRTQSVEAAAPMIAALAEELAASWHDGEEVEVHRAMGILALRVVGFQFFDLDLTADAARITDDLAYALRIATRMRLPLVPLWARSPLPSARRYASAIASLNEVAIDIVERRRARGVEGDDLLGMLLAAQATEPELDDQQLRDEVATAFLAGHETTANLLTWTWSLLAQHPDVRTQVEAEVDRVVGDRPPTLEDLDHLPLVHRVFLEALRLRPPIWVMGRMPTVDRDIGGYPIPSGASVLLNQYVLHRDPRFFPNPSAFDPSRWEHANGRPRYAYFPFGGGERQCPGGDFALLEARLVLATIVRRWRIEPLSPATPRPAFKLTLRPRDGLRSRIMARRPSGVPALPAPEAHARVWQASHGQRLWRAHSDRINRALVERWLPSGLDRVLKTDLWDEAVGCGLVPELRRHAGSVDAIDISQDVIDGALTRYPEIAATLADVRRLPFEDGTFDAVVSNSTLDHFDDAAEIRAAIAELARVTRAGGTLLLTLDNPRNPLVAATKALPRAQLNRFWLRHGGVAGRLGLLPYHVGVTVGPQRLRRIVEWAGFEVEAQEEVVHAPRLPAVLVGNLLERSRRKHAEEVFSRLLEAVEGARTLPVAGVTGNFVALRARRR